MPEQASFMHGGKAPLCIMARVLYEFLQGSLNHNGKAPLSMMARLR